MAKSRTILIWHNNGEQQFTFTVNPERLRVSRPNCNRVERLAMGGTVNLWGGRGLREVSFTTFLPEERSPFYGDAVRLLGDEGEEVFLGAVQAVSRNVETVTLIACDRGLYLTANELSGVFAGSPEGICRAVAMRLSLPVGTLEVPAGWKRLVAGAGVRAFDILRQAVGEDREISIQNGALTVTKAGQERFVIAEETVLASRGTADARQMVNRCAVIDRRGAAAATAQNTTDLARFGLRQRVLGKSGDAAAQAQGGLRGRILRGELTVRGDLRYRCGAMVELHRKEFGLDGAYPLTAVKHRWERGLFTTELTWEGEV